MILRTHRRNLVVWSSSAGPAGRDGAPRLRRRARTRAIRRCIRTSALLTVMGLVGLVRGVRRPRWGLLLAGVVLTVTGIMLRSSPGGVVLLPGLLFVLSAPLIPDIPEADRKRHCELERELAAYSTPAQRCDLEATLDQYPDGITYELRDILASQAMAAYSNGIPGIRRS
jgi:hypothetical protein